MNTIKIMTPLEVKTIATSINNEISDLMIDESITLCQRSIIVPSIGQEWWDEIVLQKSGGTYSAANKVIVDNYLKYILSYGVWQNLVVTLSYQLNSAGLRLKQSEHSMLAESKDIQYYREYTQNFIDATRREMYRYIKDNASLYPLYFDNKYHEKPKNNQYNFKVGSVGGIKNNTYRYIGNK